MAMSEQNLLRIKAAEMTFPGMAVGARIANSYNNKEYMMNGRAGFIN